MRTKNDIKLGVSLYSYQETYWNRSLDLEGCLTAVAGAGAEGIEIFGEAMIPDFPFVGDEFLYKWFYMLDNLQLEPVCYEHFADRTFWKDHNRYLDDDGVFESTCQYLRTARKLGCKFIKLSHDGHNGVFIMSAEKSHSVVNAELFERLLPVAEENGVVMALEIHGPGRLEDGGNDDFIDVLERTGSQYGKLCLDFSGCFRDDYPNQVKMQIQRGANPDCIELTRAFRRKAFTYTSTDSGPNDVDWSELDAKLKEMGASPIDLAYAQRARNKMSPPKVIKEYASKLGYIHGKMNWVNEDCTCDEMDYPLYMKALQEGGYKGYISTEFEGQRIIPGTINEIELVRRHHILMRNALGYK